MKPKEPAGKSFYCSSYPYIPSLGSSHSLSGLYHSGKAKFPSSKY
jgi:hypothetical protein